MKQQGNAKVHESVSVFSGYLNDGKHLKNIGKKCFGGRFFQPNLSNLQPMTALNNTTEEALSGGEMTTFTTNHQPKSKIFMMTLAEVALFKTAIGDVVWVGCH